MLRRAKTAFLSKLVKRKGPFIATQLNSTQLTQLNSIQPISAKQVSRVFVHDVTTYKLSELGHYVH